MSYEPISQHPDVVFLYGGGPHPFHDASCTCPEHCGNCYADLVHSGAPARARYCSAYCKGRAARERALDRDILARISPTGGAR